MTTPRTDAEAQENAGTRFDGYVHEEFARELEREAARYRSALEYVRDHHHEGCGEFDDRVDHALNPKESP